MSYSCWLDQLLVGGIKVLVELRRAYFSNILYAPNVTNLGCSIKVWQWHYNTDKCRSEEIRGGAFSIRPFFVHLFNFFLLFTLSFPNYASKRVRRKKGKNIYFHQQSQCATLICWSKYTTHFSNTRKGRKQNCRILNARTEAIKMRRTIVNSCACTYMNIWHLATIPKPSY